jgi:hypothetical protein
MPARADTKVHGRLWVKRCSPSHRGVRSASVVLKNFVRQPKKTFSTLSPGKRTNLIGPNGHVTDEYEPPGRLVMFDLFYHQSMQAPDRIELARWQSFRSMTTDDV